MSIGEFAPNFDAEQEPRVDERRIGHTLEPINEVERIALQSGTADVILTEASWNAILQELKPFDSLDATGSLYSIETITGLPEETAKKIAEGMQARGLMSDKPITRGRKKGQYEVYQKPRKVDEDPARSLGFVIVRSSRDGHDANIRKRGTPVPLPMRREDEERRSRTLDDFDSFDDFDTFDDGYDPRVIPIEFIDRRDRGFGDEEEGDEDTPYYRNIGSRVIPIVFLSRKDRGLANDDEADTSYSRHNSSRVIDIEFIDRKDRGFGTDEELDEDTASTNRKVGSRVIPIAFIDPEDRGMTSYQAGDEAETAPRHDPSRVIPIEFIDPEDRDLRHHRADND